jgi:hypothetical protein
VGGRLCATRFPRPRGDPVTTPAGQPARTAITRGDVVAFLDEDAVADSGWLTFFADSYADPAVIGVGGLTLPNWKASRPSWFPTEFDWTIGCRYRGMPESRAPVRNLLGGNASFRRAAFASREDSITASAAPPGSGPSAARRRSSASG